MPKRRPFIFLFLFSYFYSISDAIVNYNRILLSMKEVLLLYKCVCFFRCHRSILFSRRNLQLTNRIVLLLSRYYAMYVRGGPKNRTIFKCV